MSCHCCGQILLVTQQNLKTTNASFDEPFRRRGKHRALRSSRFRICIARSCSQDCFAPSTSAQVVRKTQQKENILTQSILVPTTKQRNGAIRIPKAGRPYQGGSPKRFCAIFERLSGPLETQASETSKSTFVVVYFFLAFAHQRSLTSNYSQEAPA